MINSEVVNEAISYIMEHINEDISVEDVAEHCHFSRFHFSRLFKQEVGESVYAYIKRLKMEQSAFRLKVEKERSITDIGYDYGYSPSNYSVVFRRHHEVSPTEFRKSILEKSMKKNPNWQLDGDNTEPELRSYEDCNKKISIKTIDDFRVLYERHKGSYGDLKTAWHAFTQKYSEYITEETRFIERTFDDPSITETDSCLYDICMTVEENSPFENTYIIPGGKYAVYHFAGYPWQIYGAYQNLFNVWFHQSGYQIDRRYNFDVYHEVNDETMYMVIDFYIPVKE